MFCQGLLPDRMSRHGRGREERWCTHIVVDDECGVMGWQCLFTEITALPGIGVVKGS